MCLYVFIAKMEYLQTENERFRTFPNVTGLKTIPVSYNRSTNNSESDRESERPKGPISRI